MTARVTTRRERVTLRATTSRVPTPHATTSRVPTPQATTSRLVGVGVFVVSCLALALGPLASRALAEDALDAAIIRASQAAAKDDWEAAATSLESAYELVPGPSAQLEYDLGTAYAQLGELGYAYAHLRRAVELGLASETLEAARRNQGIVRRRAEIAAAVNGTTISPPSAWSARIEDLLARPWIGALALALGGLHVLLAATWVWARRSTAVLRMSLVCAVAGGTVLAAHVWAATRPLQAVVLHDVELRDGPGDHRAVTATVQASSVGALLEDNGRWSKVRITDDVVGWIPASSVARFRVGVSAATEPALPTRRARRSGS
jgi:hypothetical protein